MNMSEWPIFEVAGKEVDERHFVRAPGKSYLYQVFLPDYWNITEIKIVSIGNAVEAHELVSLQEQVQ